MTYSKAQNKWRQAGRRSLLLLAVLSLVISLLGLPLYAKTMNTNSPAGRMVEDVKRGARDLGRGVRDMVDPDRDGILPDGSVDNGIANDGNQFDGEHGNMTGNVSDNVTGVIPDTPHSSSGMLDEVRPDTPVTDNSHPSPDDNANGNHAGDVTDNAAGDMNGTSNGAAATDTPATSDAGADNTDNTDGKTEGGFRWTGLIIALVIAAAVIVLIWLLIPKKKNR